MISAGPASGTKNSILKNVSSSPMREDEPLGELGELGLSLPRKPRRILEALERDRPRIHDRVGDADRRLPDPRARTRRASPRGLPGAPRPETPGHGRAAHRRGRRLRRSDRRTRPVGEVGRSSSVSTRSACCERRPTTGLTKKGGSNGSFCPSSANAGVDSRATESWIRRDVGLCWHARSASGEGPGRPRRAARIEARSAD